MDRASIARRLPEEFVSAPGLPVQRALLLAYRHWPNRPESDLRDLAHELLGILEPLLRSSRDGVSSAVRDACQRVVQEWEERTMAKQFSPPDK